MATDTTTEYIITEKSNLVSIADAIRSANNSTEELQLSELVSQAVNKISENGDFNNTIAEYDQMNETAKNYLQSAESYNSNDDYSTTVAQQYYSASESANHDDPVGYDVSITSSGSIYITDETTGHTFMDTVSAGTYTLYNVIPNHIYFYRIVDSNGNTIKTGRLKGTGFLRMLKTYSTSNFRDLGGWSCDGGTIKYGYLLRGGKVGTNSGVSASAKDLKMIRDFGTLVEIDLRGDAETGKDTEDVSDDLTVSQAGSYIDYYDFTMGYIVNAIMPNRDEITTTVAVLKLIMNSVVNDAPVYYHCSAGADRTGGISYVLEGLLGVSETDMMKEYELTTLAPYLERYRTNLAQTAEYIKTLDGDTWQDKWISWAFEVGFTADELNAFRSKIIDGTPTTIQSPKATYTITNSLTNITTSNSISSITEGNSYSATLTAYSGYEIGSVTVTMGGTDITSSAYSSGSITIDSVTGDIIITASANEIEVSYTNLVPTALDFDLSTIYGNGNGYINGKYASEWNSDGDDSAFVCTGLIPMNVSSSNSTNDIYIKGATLDTSLSHTRCRMSYADATNYHFWVNGSNFSTYFTITELGTNYYKLSVADTVIALNIALFKFSLKGIGDSLIITFNEPIE